MPFLRWRWWPLAAPGWSNHSPGGLSGMAPITIFINSTGPFWLAFSRSIMAMRSSRDFLCASKATTSAVMTLSSAASHLQQVDLLLQIGSTAGCVQVPATHSNDPKHKQQNAVLLDGRSFDSFKRWKQIDLYHC